MEMITSEKKLAMRTYLVKILYSLCIWSLAIVGVLKLFTGTDYGPTPMHAPIDAAITTEATHYSAEMLAAVNKDTANEELLVQEIESHLPSLPIVYWSKHKQSVQQKSANCSKYPLLFELEFNNMYWQTQRTSNGTFQLFGAYYDTRLPAGPAGTVRILGMLDRIEPKVKTYCQIWYEGKKQPTIVRTLEYKYIWVKQWGSYKQGIYQPYLISCQLPKSTQGAVPSSVSLVEHECDQATNNLRVIYNQPAAGVEKKGFAVCVKGLDFLNEDLSIRLVEWIELLHILGADKIFFYNLQVHANIMKVLEHYEQKGKVKVVPLTLPGGQPNMPGFQHLFLSKNVGKKRLDEIIPYNDCLYKNIYLYKYITLLDIDEVIMPKGDIMYWSDLMEKVLNQSLKARSGGHHSYHFRNVYFLDDQQKDHGWNKDIPRYMHMLQHVHRTTNYSKPSHYVKTFHDPQRVLTLHNHFPRACLGGACHSYAVDTQTAQMQHYRADCVKELKQKCAEYRANTVEDTTIWKYKDELIKRTTKTLKSLGILRNNSATIAKPQMLISGLAAVF